MQDIQLENESQPICASIFRAYDIRGIYGETLTSNIIYQVGLALGSEARARGVSAIITGRDCRLSGPELIKALHAGLLATGCDVIDIGLVPTPVLYFATQILNTQSGVMLTGSHNPRNHNGLKIVLEGKTLKENDIKHLYQRICDKNFIYGEGQLSQADVISDYIHRISQDVHLARPLKVVIDSANGATGELAPHLMRALHCEVIELFCEMDGHFPNHDPDPSQPENLMALIAAVKEHKADLGLAFDGDGDRLGVVTNKGEIIWADRQMMLFAKEILKNHPKATIIFDIKCSKQLAKMIEDLGGNPIMWRTGHSLIKAKMQETGAKFAGEMSGHLFFKDRWYGFDDGLYAAARLLEIISKQKEDVASLFNHLPNSINTPELKIPMPDFKKFIFMEAFLAQAKFEGAHLITIDGIRVDYSSGWGLLRPSNTTPYLILRFEAVDESALLWIKNKFREELLAVDKTLELPF